MPAGDLCTLPDVKAWLLIAVSNTGDDAILTRLITACSDAVKNFTQRPLQEASFTESYNGTGTPSLVLRNGPISAVSALSIGLQDVPPASAQVGGFVFNPTTIYLSKAPSWPVFPAGNLNVLVAYTAGFAPGSTELSAISQACIEFVAFKFLQRKHIGQKTANIQAGGMGTSYQEGEMPPEVMAALKRFKRVVPT